MSTAHHQSEHDLSKSPVLKGTAYDKTSSGMVTVLIASVVIFAFFFFLWYNNRPPQPEVFVPVEMIELTGGDPDGAPDETLELETPEEEVKDPAIDPVNEKDPEMTETFENVVELATEAAEQVPEQFDTAVESSGQTGSSKGTGKRPLGSGPGNAGGFSREQRWFVRYGDDVSIDEYASQLDYFQIELGALTNDGKLYYVSNLSAAKPNVKSVDSGKDEKRLYLTWTGGERKKADQDLLKKAGISGTPRVIFHFYSPKTENYLAQIEFAYKNRAYKDIRRTYFSVIGSAGKYDFIVTQQTYIR